MEKKDILELNKKARQDDEGFLDLQRRTAVIGRTCALVLAALFQLFCVARQIPNNNEFKIIIMGSLGIESLANYWISRQKFALVGGILCTAMCLFDLGQYLMLYA